MGETGIKTEVVSSNLVQEFKAAEVMGEVELYSVGKDHQVTPGPDSVVYLLLRSERRASVPRLGTSEFIKANDLALLKVRFEKQPGGGFVSVEGLTIQNAPSHEAVDELVGEFSNPVNPVTPLSPERYDLRQATGALASSKDYPGALPEVGDGIFVKTAKAKAFFRVPDVASTENGLNAVRNWEIVEARAPKAVEKVK